MSETAEKRAEPTPERANEIAFEWLSLHGRHAPHCKHVRCRIVPQEPRSGLCKDYGGRYATEEELEKIACTCGLDDMQKALCQAAAPDAAHCSFAGPGRGDCEHFIGLPGKSIPGQHDDSDDTVDVYGKPNEWCWFCWHSLQIDRLQVANAALVEGLDIAMKLACPSCAKGYPTDKTWEQGNSDGLDRKGLYHPDRNYSGTGFGGGYHKCKAWKVRAVLKVHSIVLQGDGS